MLVTAQQSGADVIWIANGGNDTNNTVKQATEFGITRDSKQRIALLGTNDVHGIGLDIAQNPFVADACPHEHIARQLRLGISRNVQQMPPRASFCAKSEPPSNQLSREWPGR